MMDGEGPVFAPGWGVAGKQDLKMCPCPCECGYTADDGKLCYYCKRHEHHGSKLPPPTGQASEGVLEVKDPPLFLQIEDAEDVTLIPVSSIEQILATDGGCNVYRNGDLQILECKTSFSEVARRLGVEMAPVTAHRPETQRDEEAFRDALERIKVALGMEGRVDLAEGVPRMVEELLSIDDVNWRARELLEVKGPR